MAAAAAIAALVLGAAACGSDDDDADTGAADTAETTAGDGSTDTTAAADAPEGSLLRIGLLVDQSGPSAPGQREAADVAAAWAEDVNGTGGIAGHPVEIVVEDTRGDAPTGSAAAQEFVDDPSMIATLVVDAGGEAAWAPSLSEGGLPVIGGMGYYPTVWGALPNVFGITTSFPDVVNEQVIAAEAAGATTTAVAACAEVAACSAAAPIFEAASETLGLEFSGTVSIAADAPDYVAECLQFIDDGVDYVQLSATGATVQRLAADCQTQGYTGVFGASAGTVNPGLYDGFTGTLTGGLNGFPWFVDAEPVQRFRDVMEAGGVEEESYSNPVATATYASLELFRTVVEANAETLGENPDRAGLVAAYGTVAGETLGGLLPEPVTFTADQPGPPISCFWLYTFENGEFSGDFEPTCPGPEFG